MLSYESLWIFSDSNINNFSLCIKKAPNLVFLGSKVQISHEKDLALLYILPLLFIAASAS
jgi:hypothetical protein